MSRYLVDRIEANERIAVRTSTHVSRVEGGDWLEQVVVAGTDGEASLDAGGMVVLIGGEPLTAGVEDWLRCDAGGYLMTGTRTVCRGRPQLVAAGTRPALPRIEPPRAVRRGQRPSRLDQARRIGRRRRRNVDRAGAQLRSHNRPGPAVNLRPPSASCSFPRRARRHHARVHVDAVVSAEAVWTLAPDDQQKRDSAETSHPIHRHNVGACALAIGGSSSTVAVATRHTGQWQRI
jgi:hypothetical protein